MIGYLVIDETENKINKAEKREKEKSKILFKTQKN